MTSDSKWDVASDAAERLRDGDVDGAIDDLERIVAADPNNEYGFFFLGSALFEKGEFPRALKAYVNALALAPEYLGAMIAAGQTLRMLGRHEEAIRMANEVLRRRSGDPDALHLLGLAHMARGESAAARKHLRAFLETKPELEVALEVEGLLKTLTGEVISLEPSDDDRWN